MKKKQVSLKLNKHKIANLKSSEISGGLSGRFCISDTYCPTEINHGCNTWEEDCPSDWC